MLRAYRSIAQLKDSRGFRQWLLRIVENLAIDGARRDRGRRRIGERANPSELSTVEARDDAPEKQAEIAESRAKVLAVLRSLPDEYRLPLMLRYIGGADYDAIATQLGMTNGALRGALHRGLRMMRERLGGQ
jgi:RNA polymerase sigma-70 factor (ECF subfamily)